VHGAGPQKLLTNIISLIHFAIGEADVLEPFSETVDRRFEYWLTLQRKLNRQFTPEQMAWLTMIKEHIAASLSINIDNFTLTPFAEKGGAVKAYGLFEGELDSLIDELNKELVA